MAKIVTLEVGNSIPAHISAPEATDCHKAAKPLKNSYLAEIYPGEGTIIPHPWRP